MPAVRQFCLLLAVAACAAAFPARAQEAGAPVPVSVVTVAPEALAVVNELPGRIAPTRIAEVRPRVSGIIVERVFEQGSQVEEGDILYRIDPAPFAVQVASARATLQRAHAAQLNARQRADRQAELRDRNIASSQQLDDAVAQLAQADADVAVAEANLAQAQLNFDYSEVKAPISGRIGRAMVTEGALVSSNDVSSLARIQALDPVYADFTQSASELLRLRRALAAGALARVGPDEAQVRLRLDDGSDHAHPGRLMFSEATVDETTGQVTLRASFPNPEGDLLPGMYVRVAIEQGIQNNAIAVPQQAVQRDAGGQAHVFVVGAGDKAELRPIRIDRLAGTRVVVSEGLAAGDRVIVEGFQKVRPGAAVSATEWTRQAPAGMRSAAAGAPATSN